MTIFRYRTVALFVLLAVFSSFTVAGPSGKEIYDEILAGTALYDDTELTAYIEDLGRQIVAVSGKSGESFTFSLLDSPDLNAFATRGNYVYVNRGLLNYVSNEAQLVSVLAHEVAHITQDHVTGQEGQATGAQILSTIAAVLAGSQEVYEAGMAYANSLIRGHGRSNELEADQVGAQYMARLGFDPKEMLTMLAIMKDYETLQKERAKERGAPRQTYHGIFSSHPRNDSRLRSVVSSASSAASDSSRGSGATQYRQFTEGLIWGENFLAKENKPERYSNMDWRIRFDFPQGWTQKLDQDSEIVTGQAENDEARLTMYQKGRTTQSPEEYLYNYLKVSQLKDGKQIQPARLKGFTGILPGTNAQADTRIAVIYYKLKAYIFTGEVKEQKKFSEYDKQFLDAIATFRPISSREIAGQKPKKIHYVKATSTTTFEALAKLLNLKQSEADDLRLINGYYPSGEPTTGEWIKIFKQ